MKCFNPYIYIFSNFFYLGELILKDYSAIKSTDTVSYTSLEKYI